MVRKVREVQNDRLRGQLHDPNLRAVITVSQASRADIVRVLGDLPCPLVVVPELRVQQHSPQRLRAARHDHATTEPFLLAVGVYIPTKNIPRLCRAFRLARQMAPEVGAAAPGPGRADRVGARVPDQRRTGTSRCSATSATTSWPRLYASCTAFVFPSFYEGFGIPMHEALLAGAPVLCSDIPVFREIGGDLVHYADPHDDTILAKAIVTRCKDPGPTAEKVDRFTGDVQRTCDRQSARRRISDRNRKPPAGGRDDNDLHARLNPRQARWSATTSRHRA